MTKAAAFSTTHAKRILVVDDSLEVAEMLRLQLAHCGHDVDTTHNGDEGLAKFKLGKYDLVMTDYSMPKMNGIELAQAIKQQDTKQPIILMTGYAFSIASNHAGPLPVDSILSKPFSMDEFHAVLKKLTA
jgi:CheY-like chemotaxis protein